ncbi:MAG: STM4504/CBY_0614 family protein [Novosphingobium sp.]
MPIFDLFSKRQSDATKSGKADVYQYTDIPLNLRIQVEQISLEAIGIVGFRGDRLRANEHNDWWVQIERVFLRERGLDSIGREVFEGDRILSFMRNCTTADWLDFVELIAIAINGVGDEQAFWRQRWNVSIEAEDSISELNYRLRQAGVGFQLEESRLIRIDSQFIHSEVVKPALELLSGQGFDGPRQEFLSAHSHYRAGEHRQAIAMAANAMESMFKAVFDKKGWCYQKGARISDLTKIARTNGLWPDYLDASFDQLIATLQSGLPKIRDNDASHGQGSKAKEVPGFVAAYALHLAASKIVFIGEAAK